MVSFLAPLASAVGSGRRHAVFGHALDERTMRKLERAHPIIRGPVALHSFVTPFLLLPAHSQPLQHGSSPSPHTTAIPQSRSPAVV